MAEPPRRSLAGASALMMVSTGALNLAMVVYHREMSDRLGLAYADLAAMLGILNVIAVLFSGLGTWLTRDFAAAVALGGEGAALRRFRHLAPGVGVGTLAVAALLALVGPFLVRELALSSPGLPLAAAAVVAGGLLLSLLRALLQGLHRFGLLGSSYLVEAAGRALLPALGAAYAGVQGAFWATAVVSVLAGVAVAPVFWGHRGPVTDWAPAEALRWDHLLRDTAALGLFSVVGFLDILVVKHTLGLSDPAGAAFYSRAALVGKSLLYAASAFNMVALPAISAAWAQGRDPRPLLRRFFLAMLAVEGVALAGLWLFTPFMVRVLLKSPPQADELVKVVPYFALAVLPLALYQLLLFHALAVHAKGVVTLLAVVTLLYAGSLVLWHDGPRQVIACLAGASTLLLLGGWIQVARRVPAAV